MPGLEGAKRLAQQAKDVLDKQAEQKREAKIEKIAENPIKFQNEKVNMPQGLSVNVRPFLEARQRIHRKQNEVFDDAKKLIKEPAKDCHYGWARLNQPVTVMRAAQGAYRYVKPDELIGKMADMFTTHKGTSGQMVCFGSLVLIEISEQAWQDFHVEPEIEAVARLASQQAMLASNLEEHSEGRVRMVTETGSETETLS
ncbi:MAG: hypothetical protein KGL39_27205 [Patescibacteria group bacterium]|nr:hypothetical protein [Patescibacteria group bacterium]